MEARCTVQLESKEGWARKREGKLDETLEESKRNAHQTKEEGTCFFLFELSFHYVRFAWRG